MLLARDKVRDEAISVVIPALNEEREIGECLKSLACQTYSEFEVIVVDNGSTDATASIARAHGAQVIHEPQRGVSRTRQAGFTAAQADIIASTDADTVVPSDWLERIHQAFEEDPTVWGVFGPFRLKRGSSPDPRINCLIPYLESIARSYHRGTATFGLPHFFGANFAVRRDAFLRVHGFRSPRDGHYYRRSEDIQLGLKLHRLGKVRFRGDLTVWTSARKLRGGLWKGLVSNVPDYFSFFVRKGEE